MSALLSIRGLEKRFGERAVLRGVTFDVAPGEVRGFIGPNGAGKTTTMRIAATLELPDGGDVLLEGRSVRDEPRRARAGLGFMPDGADVFGDATVVEYLDFFARAQGLRGADRRRTVQDVLAFTSLAEHGALEASRMSKGMKQRLCLARTLLHDPRVLVLDEPASGLDPRARVELRDLVLALAERGKAVLISSHILTELAEICTTVTILESGVVRASGSVDDLLRGGSDRIRVRALAAQDALLRFLLEQPGVANVEPVERGARFSLDGAEEALAALLAQMVASGLQPVHVAPERADLEDLFLRLTENRLQ